jgi:3-oxoacyl-[acyl-carrier protein] reductase
MHISFKDKNVLITGAATGIGRAIAEAFAVAEAHVIVNHLNQSELAQAFAKNIIDNGGSASAINADVRSATDVRNMVGEVTDEFGAIDVLVNNVGVNRVKPFLELTEDDWDVVLGTNLKSVFHCCQAVLPGMLAQQQGVIINIASELGYLGRAQFAPYTASKGGMITLTRSLAREFAPDVRINAIAPGPVMTDMLRGELQSEQDLRNEMDIPMRRVANAEEIAGSAVFLASEYASFYCGDVISPNGGSLMR